MSDVLPLTEPDLNVVSDDEYRFEWSCGVDAIVEMMAEHSHEISAHVTWQTKSGRISASRFNLGAARTRTEVANGLARRLPEFDWSGMVEQLCILTTDRWRQGEPSVDMRSFQPSTDGRWLLEPYVERADATVLFARGGSGKSMFALAVAVSIASGQEIVGRLHGASGPVLYLDWETGSQTFAERIRAICLSSGIPIPPIHYQHMVASLPEAASTLAREVRRTKAVFAVVDSLGMARGGEPESADLTLRTFKAGRGLGVPWLAVDHVTKAEGKDAQEPFGSAYTRNAARLMWSLTRAQSTGDIALRLRKANNGPDGLQMAYKVRVSKDSGDSISGIAYESFGLDQTSFADRVPLRSRIHVGLAAGGLTREQLADALGEDLKNIQNRVSDMKKNGELIEMDKRLWIPSREN